MLPNPTFPLSPAIAIELIKIADNRFCSRNLVTTDSYAQTLSHVVAEYLLLTNVSSTFTPAQLAHDVERIAYPSRRLSDGAISVHPATEDGRFLICQECGKKSKMLRRHLAHAHGMTPDMYRLKYNFTATTLLTSPHTSATRRSIAKLNGLGKTKKK